MNTKFLIFLTWIFYLAGKSSHDQVWLFCSFYSGLITICAFFYGLENRRKVSRKKKKKAK